MKRVLVVVDMQNDFIDGALGSKEAKNIVLPVAEKIKEYIKSGDCVYFTMDTHEENYLDTQEGRNLPVEHCIRETFGWALQKEIKCLAQQVNQGVSQSAIFEKNIFGSEKLAAMLRAELKGQKDAAVELVGLCTDICVISNAMLIKTYMPEVGIKVDAGCCAGVTPESHRNALNAMKMCQIKISND